ncbi:MAG TPA: GntR family transcriptional regulator [Nocardioidaceae bacterium]|nr:GntR family transcriptional regulator [Nocardioidaceae bacterium]
MTTPLENHDPTPAPSLPEATVKSWARVNAASAVSSSRKLIVMALREAIVSGEIGAGQQLKQDELAATFRVSPAPVREALWQLASEGLVRHHPNRGAFVTELPTDEAIGVLLPVRLLLEDHALRRVARNLGEQLVRDLERQILVMQQGADRGDVATINEADVRFHELAMEASGAYHAIQLWHSVLPRIRRQLYVLTPRHADLQYVPEEHRVLLCALQAGDPENLSATLREHIITASSTLMAGAAQPLDHDNGP